MIETLQILDSNARALIRFMAQLELERLGLMKLGLELKTLRLRLNLGF